MQIYKRVPATNDKDDLADLIAAATLGDNVEKLLLDAKSPFAMMLEHARDDFIVATAALLAADLQTSSGVDQARRLQAEANRYKDMCFYISDALEKREAAVNDLDGEVEDDAVEELKEQQNGTRSKPARDA